MRSLRPWKCILLLSLLCVACTERPDASQGAGPVAAREETDVPAILFLCPHNASKSVMAAAHFQRLADELDLGVKALSAGTHPGEKIDPRVIELLREQGIPYEEHAPRAVTEEQMSEAFKVVSLGCEPADLPPSPAPLIRWDDIPPPSQDLGRAHDEIVLRVEALVRELSAKTGPDR